MFPKFTASGFVWTKLAVSSNVIVPPLLVNLSVTFRVLPLFTVKLELADIVIVLANAGVLVSSTISCEPFWIITSEVAVGTLPQDQFEAVNQLEWIVPPVQVLDEFTVTDAVVLSADAQEPLVITAL